MFLLITLKHLTVYLKILSEKLVKEHRSIRISLYLLQELYKNVKAYAIERIIHKVPNRDVLIVQGDFNSKTEN